jgi:hypothetical protein
MEFREECHIPASNSDRRASSRVRPLGGKGSIFDRRAFRDTGGKSIDSNVVVWNAIATLAIAGMNGDGRDSNLSPTRGAVLEIVVRSMLGDCDSKESSVIFFSLILRFLVRT